MIECLISVVYGYVLDMFPVQRFRYKSQTVVEAGSVAPSAPSSPSSARSALRLDFASELKTFVSCALFVEKYLEMVEDQSALRSLLVGKYLDMVES